MRYLLTAIVAGAMGLLPLTQAGAQGRPTTVLAGYGGIDHEGRLGPAYHLNLRAQLARQDSLVLEPRYGERRVLPKMELQGELFGQAGGGGSGLVGCRETPGSTCVQSVDGAYLVGAGFIGRIDLFREKRWGVIYFLPLSAGAYLRGFGVEEWPVGGGQATTSEGVRLSGGVGNGMGVELRVGGVRAVAEVRAILARDLRGGRGGSLPVSVGITW